MQCLYGLKRKFVHGQFEFEHENIYFNLSEGIIGFQVDLENAKRKTKCADDKLIENRMFIKVKRRQPTAEADVTQPILAQGLNDSSKQRQQTEQLIKMDTRLCSHCTDSCDIYNIIAIGRWFCVFLASRSSSPAMRCLCRHLCMCVCAIYMCVSVNS